LAAKLRQMAYKADYSDGDTRGPLRTVDADNSGSIMLIAPSGMTGVTPEGGHVCRLYNKTNLTSVKGWVISPSTSSAMSYQLNASSSFETAFGIVYDTVAPNALGYIVTHGIADVLIGGGAVACNDVLVTQPGNPGRASGSAPPTPGTMQGHNLHFRTLGYALETHASGSDYLIKTALMMLA
jgi:hypothetical protein